MSTRCCRYNVGVLCEDQRRCLRCGWNPEKCALRRAMLRHFGPDALMAQAPAAPAGSSDDEAEVTP